MNRPTILRGPFYAEPRRQLDRHTVRFIWLIFFAGLFLGIALTLGGQKLLRDYRDGGRSQGAIHLQR